MGAYNNVRQSAEGVMYSEPPTVGGPCPNCGFSPWSDEHRYQRETVFVALPADVVGAVRNLCRNLIDNEACCQMRGRAESHDIDCVALSLLAALPKEADDG